MKTVLITGASRGIGKACTQLFHDNGWNIIAHARKETSDFERFCQRIHAIPLYFDITDIPSMKAAIKDAIFDSKVEITALINNAGIADAGLFQMRPIDKIRQVFEVNLFAHMELTQLLLRRMAKQDASIVNVTSVAGQILPQGSSAYGVSKAAMIAWTKVLANELLGSVRVNAVAPGMTGTDMAKEMLELNKITLRENAKLGNACEIAEAIYFLASNKSSFVNGQTLVVDGGYESTGRLYDN